MILVPIESAYIRVPISQ